MIKLCYIILVHENIETTARIIKLLSGDNIGFVIHVDIKCNEKIDSLKEISGVHVVNKRFDIKWGDETMVTTVMHLSKEALKLNIKYDYFILLSGQCLPVKTPDYIKQYISNDNLANYDLAYPLPSPSLCWLEKGRRRLECYALRIGKRDIATIEPRSFNKGNLRQIAKTLIKGNITSIIKLFELLFFAPKRTGFNLKPYGGEFWWRLNRDSLNKIVEYFYSDNKLRKEIKYIAIPDEIIFNTLIYNLCSNIKDSILTFINWKGGKSPDWLTLKEKNRINEIINNPDYLFCRKVRDVDVINYVEKNLFHC